MLKRFIFSFLLFSSCISFSQQEFTIAQLTGKGEGPKLGLVSLNRLQKDTREAFDSMWAAALIDGVDIKIVSGYRSFERQKQIWTSKYNRFTSDGMSPTEVIDKIIEYSTIPGTSRHHWGTDIDIIDNGETRPKSALEEEHFVEGGVYYKLKQWMDTHAHEYDFYLVYTNDENRKGFKYEPWHYSYEPVAKRMLKEFSQIDIKKILISDGLVGAEYFSEAFIKRYLNENVLDINPILIDTTDE